MSDQQKSRRGFIKKSSMAAAMLPVMSTSLFSQAASQADINKANQSLKILILGGTSFLGPHQIAYAIARGHKISTFTRGKTKPTVHAKLFDQVEQLVGDREDNLEAIKNRAWDAVIDNSGRRTHWTKATAQLLKDKVGLYAYVSSVSAYYPYYKAEVDENDPVLTEIRDNIEEGEQGLYDYGVMKAQSELEAIQAFGKDRAIVVRPTFMFGPADRTDRFMYWPTQLAKGGDIIVPGKPTDPVQFIDVRDIAEWMIRLIETKTAGTYNGVGPASKMSTPAFVHGAHAAFGSQINYIAINDNEFLQANNMNFQAPWIRDAKKFHGMSRVKNELAISNGLTFRPLATTVKDTYDWWYSDAVTVERRKQFDENPQSMHNRQAAIIEAWKKYQSNKS